MLQSDFEKPEHIVSAKISTEALKLYIAEMHSQGCTDSAIARRFGYNRAYIQQLRSKMGLEATRGKETPTFSAEMDEDILFCREAENMTWLNIGLLMNKPPRDVMRRYEYLKQCEIEQETKAPLEVSTKKCLCCRTPFQTTDRKKEWYCEECREKNRSFGTYLDGSSLSSSNISLGRTVND